MTRRVCGGLWLALMVTGAAVGQNAPGVDGWRLAAQCWTFRNLSLLETLDQAKALGIEYLEAYPGQKLGGELEGGFGPGMSAAAIQAVKEKEAATGVKIVWFGVTGIPGGEADARKMCQWAKDMGIEGFSSEIRENQFAAVAKLLEEYDLKLGLHNHPKESYYWNPDKILEVTAGVSERIGSIADTGHWSRSGLDPIECLQKLKGRITGLHFKDLNVKGERNARDVPWGTGALNAEGMLRELKAQGFRGIISIEYEHMSPTLAEEVGKCVEWFKATSAKLAAEG